MASGESGYGHEYRFRVSKAVKGKHVNGVSLDGLGDVLVNGECMGLITRGECTRTLRSGRAALAL